MLETLAWERDINLSGPKAISASNQNLNLASTQNTIELNPSTSSRPPSPPPPQFVTSEYPTPSSVPQRLTGDYKPTRRSELSELRSRPSFINYEDLEIFRRRPVLTMAQQPLRRVSMMPVDADGYKDLLLDFDNERHPRHDHPKRSNDIMSRGASNTSIKSKITETSMC